MARVVSLFLSAVLCLPLLAQAPGTASLTGRVVDPQQRAITGARVIVTSQATGLARETSTNDEGLYLLASLPAGTYALRVSNEGFTDKSLTDLVLHVGQARIVDLRLTVADPQETITVRSESSGDAVEAGSAVDELMRTREIETLPLNGRNFLELALLLPGNSPAPNFDPTKTNTVLISSAGQLGRGGNIMVDGLDNNDDVVGGALQNISEDAVQEFQMATSRFSAELGRSGSSVVNIVTKSGTSELHGGASLYLRDRRLQGLPATLDRTVGQDFPFDRQQYSLWGGGPLKQDRAWWFGSVEYRNQDGALLVGQRDASSRTIRRTFASAPLNDLMGTWRADAKLNENNQLTGRYSVQDADDVSASTLIRSIGSASQRQVGDNTYHSATVGWTRVLAPTRVNTLSFGGNYFLNRTRPLQAGPQLTFPSLQDGASFRVPQQTRQNRLQVADNLSWMVGKHYLRFGGDVQRIDAGFLLDVFREGRIEFVEDFPTFDHNGDGQVNDNDLLFAVTLRSGFPDRSLSLPDADSTHLAFFIQDDWRLAARFTVNAGLRYEVDTDVKNNRRFDEINPLVRPFVGNERTRDLNNWGPRIGFSWGMREEKTVIRGGYGIYYDRIVLQIQSLERGLDGRALPVVVRAGNVFFMDPQTGQFPPGAPTFANPFTGFILPGAGAAGINIIDNSMQNPMIQQFNLGIQHQIAEGLVLRADALHTLGTHFLIGRTIAEVFNPVVGGPDFVVNLESSVNTRYDGLLMTLEKRFSRGHQIRAAYTLSKAFNYANDDQIPFSNGPIDPDNLRREYGPTPNDQRHRLTVLGALALPGETGLSLIWSAASGVPMDILLPDGRSRIPVIQRNAGGRQFHTPSDLNNFIRGLNEAGGLAGKPLPLVSEAARFSDSFNSLDLRLSRRWAVSDRLRLEPMVEVFNLLNRTNILGVSNLNYSGYSNVLVRDSEDPTNPGYLVSSAFGRPITTAGGVFGSGGPRAFQFAVKVSF
ncbi:MAG: TonB-dependent receptor [Acidobacteria bacterium]|nr:MAG: TonB-dependent receptor [Acidobacteriota bacterium]